MKWLIIFSILIHVFCSSGQSYFLSNLEQVIRIHQSEKDRQIEYLAAKKFHDILNDYRSQRRLNTLEWSDLHWVSALNHCNWMLNNNELTHYQRNGTKNFNGRSPSDRMLFANDLEVSCSYSGENALYNWTSTAGDVEEASDRIATSAFNQWKNSPGHYQNMVRSSHEAHAVAFRFAPDGKVWSASMFGYCSESSGFSSSQSLQAMDIRLEAKGVDENEIVTHSSEASTSKRIRLTASNLQKYLLEDIDSQRIKEGLKKNRILNKAASKHALYLGANHKTIVTTQVKGKKNFYAKNIHNRTNKSSFGLWMISGKSKKVKEATAVIDTRNKRLSIPEIMELINKQLNQKLEGVNYSNYGIGVAVRKFRDRYYIVVVKKVV